MNIRQYAYDGTRRLTQKETLGESFESMRSVSTVAAFGRSDTDVVAKAKSSQK